MSAMADSPREGTRLRDAWRAAQLYYLQDLTMEAIGDELKISRSSVSRLLDLARSRGIVDIRVTSPVEAPQRIEAAIKDLFGVKALIVPVPERTSHIDRLDRVAVTAARLLGDFFSSNMTMGIAWGSTTSAVSRHLIKKSVPNSEVVQLNGAGNDHSTGVTYSSEILRRFGEAFGAQVTHFPVPAFFDDPATKAALWRERSTARIVDLQKKIDIALFGLGSIKAEVPSQVYIGGYLSEEDLGLLNRDGVVGDVATVFYRADGSWKDIALNLRSSGPGLDVIARVPRKLCVVSGISRLESLKGALAANLITDLIIDETTARALIAD
jgi:DNA-binding transcriptional regulator LsrR (DeoR family)